MDPIKNFVINLANSHSNSSIRKRIRESLGSLMIVVQGIWLDMYFSVSLDIFVMNSSKTKIKYDRKCLCQIQNNLIFDKVF